MSFDVDEWLSEARPPQRSVTVYGRGDLVARIEELDAEADALDSPGGVIDPRMSGSPGVALRREADALREQMRDSARTLVVRGITLDEREAIQKDLGEDGTQNDYNIAGIACCIVEPVMTRDQVQRLAKAVGIAQFQKVVDAIELVSAEAIDVPLSRAGSDTLTTQES